MFTIKADYAEFLRWTDTTAAAVHHDPWVSFIVAYASVERYLFRSALALHLAHGHEFERSAQFTQIMRFERVAPTVLEHHDWRVPRPIDDRERPVPPEEARKLGAPSQRYRPWM
jgi:hypothetical protein